MCFLTLVSLFISIIKTVLSSSNELLKDESLLENKVCMVLNKEGFQMGTWSSQSEYV